MELNAIEERGRDERDSGERQSERNICKCNTCGNERSGDINIGIPGIARLRDPRYKKSCKLVWLIVLIICSVIAIYLTISVFIEYFRIPIASKTDVIHKDKLQFPSFSICSSKFSIYLEILKKEIYNECEKLGIDSQNCETEISKRPLSDLQIDVSALWKRLHNHNLQLELKKFPSYPLDNENQSKNFRVQTIQNFIGVCTVVTQISTVYSLFINTELVVTLTEAFPSKSNTYYFIPHGLLPHQLNGYEFIHREAAILRSGYETQLKIKQKEFLRLNISGRECYDFDEETARLEKCILRYVEPISCRLPFFPSTFRECHNLSDVEVSVTTAFDALLTKVTEHCNPRSVCEEKVNAISVDFLVPFEKPDSTCLVIKFADSSITIHSEQYSYNFHSLVSDLFAYWGFFVCLSALVFVEIFEYFISRFCCSVRIEQSN